MSSSLKAEPLTSRRNWMRMAACAAMGRPEDQGLTRLAPVDEAPQDASLTGLIRQIRGITDRRDHQALVRLLPPLFRVEFDEGKGPAAFRRRWRPETPSSPLWRTLDALLPLGGTFYSDSLFAIPYVYTRFPADMDLLGHVVTVKAAANLWDQPSASANPVATVDHSILPLAEALRAPVRLERDRFLEVIHPAAGRCYVSTNDVYSPAGHRVFFERGRTGWRWISLACATLAEPPDLERLRRRT